MYAVAPELGIVREREDALHPLKGMGFPRDIARAAVCWASAEAIGGTGVALPGDGGVTAQ